MTDELKDQRIPIMMTPSEVKAIDDWMWANRIRSRGEAIRRLCKVGLDFDAAFGDTRLAIWDLYANAVAHGELIKREYKEQLPDGVWKILAVIYSTMLHNRVRKLMNTLGQATGTLRKFRELADIQEAFSEAGSLHRENTNAAEKDASQLGDLKTMLSSLPERLRPDAEDYPEIPEAIRDLLTERGEDPTTAFGIPVSNAGEPPKTRTRHRAKK
jgi:hypothetical protein